MKKSLLCITVLCFMVMGAGCSNNTQKSDKALSGDTLETISKEANEKQLQTEKTSIVLYFADNNTGKLVEERRMVDKSALVNNAEQTIINELIQGPKDNGKAAAIPQGTKLLSVNRQDSTVTVNFSEEFITNHPGGSASETLTIYSIVNSLTELKDVEKVKFLIEGKAREEYKGHYEFDIPFERDETIIKKDS